METYKVVRHFMNRSNITLRRGLSLQEAQQHCKDPETSSSTCRLAVNVRRTKRLGPWFDGYDRDRS